MSDFELPTAILVDDILTTQQAMAWLHVGKDKFEPYKRVGVGGEGRNVTYLKSQLLQVRKSIQEHQS